MYTYHITVRCNYDVKQYQIDSPIRSLLLIISQSMPEIPKLNFSHLVSCRFHYTSMLNENHLSKTCFTCASRVFSQHYVCMHVCVFFLSKLNFLLCRWEEEMPNEYVNLLVMHSLHYAPQESCVFVSAVKM